MKKLIHIISILFLSFQALSEVKELTILHTNDLHAHLFPRIAPWINESRKIGGFANLATLVKQEKQANPNNILIDAGDYFSGPYISTLTKGEAIIQSMNYLGIDAACIGNHEFDHGWDNMLEQIKKASFPILNGNLFFEGTEKLVWDNPYLILERAGLKIGIIGLHGKFAFYDTINFKMTEGIEARDEEEYLRKYLEILKPKTDIIILAVHQGMPGRQSTIGLTDVERNLYKDIKKTKSSCSFLYTPVYDSIKKNGVVEETIDKNKFYLVQTPQISQFSDLKLSIKKCIDKDMYCPDESSAIEYSNLKLSKIKGRRSNIKITEPDDLEILNKFLTRTGMGFDLHKYERGSGIILGGYKIECDFRIIAHSDGDVLLHSIADSILGASGLGDIGKHFSDQDKKNKNLDSSKIIKFCLMKLDELNLEIYNVDTTVICEQPKINPHREKILKKLSKILGISTARIGLKATTSEGIGIIGKNKAIAVQSLVNLRDKK